ncbi:uncharacterized protein C15orf39 homolog isoform X1 [Hemitrygon akajei]|uniref:uncharacterized protein C15orf39 homolog isoform X1 n=1 Tax=Hemitrygon akajei TaxID=2704970 RepID=UPI003BF9DDC1
MMASKRNLDCIDSLTCSKMPRLENEHNELSTAICKSSTQPSYMQANSLKYTGSYLAYHLRNRDGTDPSGFWSQSHPYMQTTSSPSVQSQPIEDGRLGSHLYQTESETPSSTLQRTVNEKDKLDLVKDLINVRSKWVTFVERQKSLRNGQNISSAAGKLNLLPPAVHNCGNVAFPQPVYRSSICCSGAGCSLENSADHLLRRGQDTEWRMAAPVTSACPIANSDHLMRTQQYCNPLLKNKSLHHGSSHTPISSMPRMPKETRRLPGVPSSLCQGYGSYNSNVLQDLRYSMLPYENSNGNVPSHASMHGLQNLQKHPLQLYSASEGPQVQPPFYCDKSSPPKFPIPIQPKAVHSQNTILNQQTAGPYSLLHPRGLRAQVSRCPYPVQGTGGRLPDSSSTFVGQLSPGNPYPHYSESLGYPVHHPPLQKGIPMPGPLIHPGVESGGQLELQSPSRKSSSISRQDPASGKLPPSETLHLRSQAIVDTQTEKRCYNLLNSLSSHQQLISKHSAFQPVISGKHLKGTYDRPTISPADQRPNDIYVHEHMPSIDILSNSNHGISTFSKENEGIKAKLVDSGLGSPSKCYNNSPNRKASEINFLSASSSREGRRLSAPSPPMPVINNVFSLAPYRSYLEATGLFFSRCQKCQSDCNKSVNCSCSSESKTKHNRNAGVIDPDLHKQSPVKLSKGITELQYKDAELMQSNSPLCTGASQKEGSSGMELKKAESEMNPDTQHQDINLSPNLRIHNVPHQPSSKSAAGDEPDHNARKTEVTKMQSESVLDLSIKNKNQPVAVTQPKISSASGLGEDRESPGGTIKEKEGRVVSTSNAEGRESTADATQRAPSSVPCDFREELNDKEVPSEKEENTTAESQSNKRRQSPEAPSESNGKGALKTSETSNVVNNTALTMELSKYKILRPAPARVDGPNPTQAAGDSDAKKLSLLGSVNPLRLVLRPLKLVIPDELKLPVSPVTQSKMSPCETEVGIPSNNELVQSESNTYFSFLHLHQSLCNMIVRSVAETSEEVLRGCLQDIETQNHGKENPKMRPSLKSKNNTRNVEVLKMSKSQDIWLNYGQIQPTMQKLLSHLRAYHFTRRCPFPHVIRAGTIFIPIYLVKEKLFSSVKGAMIDQVFQEHKIELRPTTLSEEKILQSEINLQRCSSRLIKLLSLKQLPEIYPDLLNVLWHSCAKVRLGGENENTLKKTAITPSPAEMGGRKNTDPGSAKKKKVVSKTPGENPPPIKEKSNDGVTVAKLGVKLRKRQRNDNISSCTNSSPVCTNSSIGTSSGHKVSPSSVDQSEGPCSTEPDQDASAAKLSKESQPVPRKLRKTTRELLDEKAIVKSNFDKKGSTLVVKLNRVVIKNDNKGPDIPCSVKIKELQPPVKKNNTALRPTRSTSKVLHLRGSIVRLKFQKSVKAPPPRNIVLKPFTTRKPLVTRNSQRLNQKKSLKPLHFKEHQEKEYPNLVGKRIRHLYEENDKTESWYKGVVLRVHEKHQNPLKTVYEVKYDTEPDWQYYLELLQDYEKGWLRVDD